ncbi:Clp protease, partial [Staphylococcus warneri]
MDINKMTYAIQGSLQRAIEYSKEFELQNIEIEAILKATLNESESLIKSVLERANIDVEELEKAYDNKLKAYPTVQGDNVQYG